MKKIRYIALFCVFSLVLSLAGAGAAAAYAPEYTGLADELYAYGLFKGNTNGYDLDQLATRLQGGVMMVRLLGAEETALRQNLSHPFLDVPDWGAPYTGYLYQNKISNGTSATRFGSNDGITAEHYCTFVLRALGYSGFDWTQSVDKSVEVGLLTASQAAALKGHNLYRDEIVLISYNALSVKEVTSGLSLLDKLIRDGAVSVPRLGNNIDAMANGASWAVSGDKVYWIAEKDSDIFVADFPSMNNRQTLLRFTHAQYMNLLDENLYFYASGIEKNEKGIYRMGIDGSGVQLVKPIEGYYAVDYVAVVNDAIFYSQGGVLSRCALDGSGDTQLIKMESRYDVRITSQKIYLIEKGTLYSYHLDGSGKQKMIDNVNRLTIGGSTIYLQGNNRKLLSMTLEGKNIKTICPALITGGQMAYDNNYVYMWTQDNVILRYNVETGNMTYVPCQKVSPALPGGLFVESGYTFTYNMTIPNTEYSDKKGTAQVQKVSVYKVTGGGSTSYEAIASVNVISSGLVTYKLTEKSSSFTREEYQAVYHAKTGAAEVVFGLVGNNECKVEIVS